MNGLSIQKKTLALLAVLIPLLALFVYVALRSGPLAPVTVTLTTVEVKPLSPALYGIGTVEARYTYKIGPTLAGRIRQLEVQVGDRVQAGQLLGEMDPVDLDQRILAQDAALKRAAAQQREAQARLDYAQTQATRYQQLLKAKATSEERVLTKQQELRVAQAALSVVVEDMVRIQAERAALVAQRQQLKLIAPVAGLVVRRAADPGTTMVAGQTIIEIIDPSSLWINVRFDQVRAQGLKDNLAAHILLRSQSGQPMTGRVYRIEPVADAVTEEVLAKVVFDHAPSPLPPLGELAEVTVELPALPAGPVIPNAAIKRQGDQLGVWQSIDDDLQFVPVEVGSSSLEGQVLIHNGLQAGDRIITYSEKALRTGSRILILDSLTGAEQ